MLHPKIFLCDPNRPILSGHISELTDLNYWRVNKSGLHWRDESDSLLSFKTVGQQDFDRVSQLYESEKSYLSKPYGLTLTTAEHFARFITGRYSKELTPEDCWLLIALLTQLPWSICNENTCNTRAFVAASTLEYLCSPHML